MSEAEDETLEDPSPQEEATPEPTLEEQLEEALQRAEAAEREIAYRDAEIQNARRRAAQERSEAIRYGGMPLARRMVAVLDDADRALAHQPESDASDLAMVRTRLWQELEGDGVTLLPGAGAMFDPSVHEALSTFGASEEAPEGTIIGVLEQGYRYRERVLRAGRVVVAHRVMESE